MKYDDRDQRLANLEIQLQDKKDMMNGLVWLGVGVWILFTIVAIGKALGYIY